MGHLISARYLILLAPLISGTLWSNVQIVPTPQYVEELEHSLVVKNGGKIEIVLYHSGTVSSPKSELAAEFLQRGLERAAASVQVHTIREKPAGTAIYLWNWDADSRPPLSLNFLDRQTLSEPDHWGQSYIIRMPEAGSPWLLGSSDQAVLLAAMTILQSVRGSDEGIEIPGLYIRDYPDFKYRAASDWLLNGEGNRWSLDRGQGIEAYRKLCKQKLDRALRYKVNMVLIDGFGWGLKERFEGYPDLMRDLSNYARKRGIRLLFGGYGASYGMVYQTGPLYEEGAYLGKVFKNRESYPDGPVYKCMGFTRGKKGVDASLLGSCRSNEGLNRLKGEELRRFVEAVEPGALYIHHEDFGSFRRTEEMWKKRCLRCRERWPNDSLLATDGGAGGLSRGYSALVDSISGVKNASSGYDAARDCQIILVSPVYHPDSEESDDWAEALELWKNIGQNLPQSLNIQVCFREVFPQKYGSEKWADRFNLTMTQAGLDLGLFLFFLGGADDYSSDYPLTGAPAMNALFLGARTIYNFTGDFYREPMEIISAEYSWNARSTGFFSDPPRNAEAIELWRRYIFQEGEPEEVFGSGKLYERVCDLLYGPQAGPIMASYYRLSEYLPDRPIKESDQLLGRGYLPMSWNRLYALPSHWRHLALDSKTWRDQISNERYADRFGRMGIERRELHRRLARRWRIGSDLNQKAAVYIKDALAANPLTDCIEDLRFLETSLRAWQPLIDSLVEYHMGLEGYFSTTRDMALVEACFNRAYVKAKEAQQAGALAFPEPVDPVGGDVGAVRKYNDLLIQAIERMQKGL